MFSHDAIVGEAIPRSRRRANASATRPNTLTPSPPPAEPAIPPPPAEPAIPPPPAEPAIPPPPGGAGNPPPAGRAGIPTKVVDVVATFGDGQRDDPGARRGEQFDDCLCVVGRVAVVDDRSDHPCLAAAVRVLQQ